MSSRSAVAAESSGQSGDARQASLATVASWRLWTAVTLACALAATLLDSVLLQQRRSFFTGGFLSADHVTSAWQAAAFFAMSLATDASVVAAVTFATLWVCGRAGVTTRRAVMVAVFASLAPIAAANFLQYRLLTYVGDAFDLGLMFDLTGRSPAELVAVTAQHLVPLLSAVAALGLVAVVIVLLIRALSRRRSGPGQPSAATSVIVGRPFMGRPTRALPISAPPLIRGVMVCVLLLVTVSALTVAVRSGSEVLDNGLRRKPTGQILGAAVVAASDVDGDGFGILGRPPDPNLFDGRIQPYAADVPGSGVDENGVAGDLPAGTAPYSETLPPLTQWPQRPDVVLIVLESFRSDAIGAEVRDKAVTPVLSELAARGVMVPQAYSHNGYTVQSRHHILSGSLAGFEIGSLVDDFRQNGYETAYFSAQDDSFGGKAGSIGLDAAEVAYDARTDRARRYTTFTTAGSLAVPHSVLLERVQGFLAARSTERPLFLYVNFHDTHFPYHHRDIRPLLSDVVIPQGDIQPGAAAAVGEMYLNTAANVDRAIGDLLGRIRRSLGREPGVIVMADHGESLFDENFLGHGYALNDAQTRIPMIVANLPLAIEEPFGQSELRGLLRRGLSASAGAVAPTVTRSPMKAVFQYLGAIERAAQIAFATDAGRIVYDIRDRTFKVGAGPWRSPDSLTDSERAQFMNLVHTWERMVLAKRRGGDGKN